MEVCLGFFSFTEVTDPGSHRAYNAWHQLDHLPEQYTIAGVAHGQRWVATPACRARWAVVGPGLAGVHYVTLYLMGQPVTETLEAFRALAVRLRRAGRYFDHRCSHLSGPFALTDRAAADRVLVSAAAVAVRPNLGVYVVVEEGASALAAPDLDPLVGVAGVAGAWSFTATAELQGAGWHPGDRRVTVCYLDEEPVVASSRLDAVVIGDNSPFPGAVAFAGAFETVVAWSWDWFDDVQAPAG